MIIFLAIMAGLVMPIQGAINNRLRSAVVSPFVMSAISFTVGVAIMTLLVIIVDHTIGFNFRLATEVPWWYWLGGPLGVVGMMTSVILIPKIGAVEMTIWSLTGQIVTGLVIDQFGWLEAALNPMTPMRLLGVAIIVASALGVVLVGSASQRRMLRRAREIDRQAGRTPTVSVGPSGNKWGNWGWRLAGFVLAGGFFGVQTAVNGRLATVTNSGFQASQLSFVTGLAILLVIVAIIRPKLQLIPGPDGRHPWWMWFGGVFGSLYVAGSSFVTPLLGPGTAIMFIQTGMLAGSLLVDHFGIAQAPVKKVLPLQLVMMLGLAGGLALVQVA